MVVEDLLSVVQPPSRFVLPLASHFKVWTNIRTANMKTLLWESLRGTCSKVPLRASKALSLLVVCSLSKEWFSCTFHVADIPACCVEPLRANFNAINHQFFVLSMTNHSRKFTYPLYHSPDPHLTPIANPQLDGVLKNQFGWQKFSGRRNRTDDRRKTLEWPWNISHCKSATWSAVSYQYSCIHKYSSS